jgi:type IV pilus assembly protein PilE
MTTPLSRQPYDPSQRSRRGYTLIEVMTVCAVVAILAALALPSLNSYLRRGKRADAITALKRVQQAQDSYLYQNGHYADKLQLLGLSSRSPQDQYALAIIEIRPDGYAATATAMPATSQAKDGICSTLTLTVSSSGAEYGPEPGCWNQ